MAIGLVPLHNARAEPQPAAPDAPANAPSAPNAADAPDAADAPTATPQQIAKWIEDLDSDLYVVRERAMGNLSKTGSAALEPLAKAADGPNLEVASRSVRLLLELSESDNVEQASNALGAIASLKNRPAERAAAEAVLRGLREQRAIAEIRRLGGVETATFVVDGQPVINQLKLGEDWKGGDEGMKLVSELKSLQVLQIYSAPVSDKGIAHLKGLENLVQVQLYGTDATAEGVAALRKALPNAEVDYREGALLGVAGIDHPQGARITQVQDGSAAGDAGIRPGDIISKYDGKAVQGFKSLREMIGKRKPGDRVTLEIIRGDETSTKEVEFGKWK